ncbi:TPA: hypothetical protein ACWQO7_004413 [Salmonella enterica]|uniref:hypothetical protein n=1 Tax=Escherichia coli TaxID=562 RepID=UPI002FBD51B1
MSVLLTEPTQQANDKVFKTAHVAFSVVTGTGRYVTGLKQFRDANPEPRQPGGCKLKTAPVRPVVAARPAEYVCSEDLFY